MSCSAFRRQHDGIGALEDGGRDIRYLRARRHRRGDHRFEHLRGDDDRLAETARDARDPLLQPGHFLDWHFDAEIAARHHQRVGNFHDLVEPRNGLRLLDLGENGGPPAHDLLHLRNVIGALHEGDRDPVDALMQGGVKIRAVLGRHRRHRDFRVGQAHALAVGHAPANIDDNDRAVRRRLDDMHAQLAVVDQHRMAGPQGFEDFRMGQMHACHVARLRVGVEHESGAVLQIHPAFSKSANAQLGPLQVGENADGAAEFLLQPANRLDTLMQHLVAGMAHVDAKHIDAGLKQALHHGAVLRGGSEGRQNLDATQPSHE